ncbi:MAG: protein YebE [Deltaproteobacteria bacterium]|nr:MAG: protein YebE [Deltaproteobacteria bacterium]
MFDAEKLLGKVVGEVLRSGSRSGKGGLLDSLGSGGGLMTMIGLGVGAMEIMKDRGGPSASPHGRFSGAPPVPPVPPSAAGPPPLPGQGPAGGAAPPPPPPMSEAAGKADMQDLAIRMVQVMIAAAHSDGVLDKNEEKRIVDRLRQAELTQEEQRFLIEELHRPRTIEELSTGVEDPGTAKTMYMLAAAAIDVDTAAERQWLDRLGQALGLSAEMMKFIEEQL